MSINRYTLINKLQKRVIKLPFINKGIICRINDLHNILNISVMSYMSTYYHQEFVIKKKQATFNFDYLVLFLKSMLTHLSPTR